MLEFHIDGKDLEKLNAFKEEHKKCIDENPNMTGAQYEYTFIPDGLGVFKSVKCVCGKSISLTGEYNLGIDEDFTPIIPTVQSAKADDICTIYIRRLFFIHKRPGLFFGDKNAGCFRYIRCFSLGFEMALNLGTDSLFWQLNSDINEALPQKIFEKDFGNSQESFDLYFSTLSNVIKMKYPEYIEYM